MKLLALDLFCGGGGACLGLQWAGFEVVGIDNKMHKNYPGHFILADALKPPVDLKDVAFVWASPPCQAFSVGTYSRGNARKQHPNLIPATRELLKGHPFTCIENVSQAPLRPDLTLWGPQVGLGPGETTHGLWRKRIFELSFFCWGLPRPKMKKGWHIPVTTTMSQTNKYYVEKQKKRGAKGGRYSPYLAKSLMGIPMCMKMTRREVGEAVPPPYAKYIAEQAMQQIKAVRFTHAT